MCGLVGYIGDKPVADILVNGLRQLEYRGYDSAGVALSCADKINIYKAEGKLDNLSSVLMLHKKEYETANMGIGHIRWATHGAPNVINAHPHTCNCGSLVIVHNGIIENHKELKKILEAKGAKFKSQTDTETVAHLIAYKYEQTKELAEAVRLASKEIEGAYALCVMHNKEKDKLVATKRNAPLLVGIGEGEYYVASDVPATIPYTKNAMYLHDNEIVTLTRQGMKLINSEGEEIPQKIETLPWEPVSLSKMGYKHFMLKEIHEQPDVIRNILVGKLHSADSPLSLEEVKLTKETLKEKGIENPSQFQLFLQNCKP